MEKSSIRPHHTFFGSFGYASIVMTAQNESYRDKIRRSLNADEARMARTGADFTKSRNYSIKHWFSIRLHLPNPRHPRSTLAEG